MFKFKFKELYISERHRVFFDKHDFLKKIYSFLNFIFENDYISFKMIFKINF